MDQKLLSVRDFCRMAGISRALFYLLLKRGTGPEVVKIGRLNKITITAAENWISNLPQKVIG